jgi:hypothetical protein
LQEFEEVLMNTDLYPKKLPAITLAKGDSFFIDWDEPIHLVALYDRSNASRLVPTIPYPPQPIYKCPNCECRWQSTIQNQAACVCMDFMLLVCEGCQPK